jgi:hypothetical protein
VRLVLVLFAIGCSDPCATEEGVAPSELRCTGLYQDWEAREISASAVPYEPALSFWSDGATKRRWLELPDAIDKSDPDEWRFPVGTKAWKEISLDGRPVETRLFWKVSADKWVRATYVWSAESAVRNDDGVPGAYSIPSRTECDQCHDGRKDRLLGVEAINFDRVAAPNEALLWLHVNCGTSCHSASPTAAAYPTGLRLRLLMSQLGRPDLDPVRTTVSVPASVPRYQGEQRVVPGAPEESLLVRLAASRGADQMPPIATHQVDADGLRKLSEWIASLPR